MNEFEKMRQQKAQQQVKAEGVDRSHQNAMKGATVENVKESPTSAPATPKAEAKPTQQQPGSTHRPPAQGLGKGTGVTNQQATPHHQKPPTTAQKTTAQAQANVQRSDAAKTNGQSKTNHQAATKAATNSRAPSRETAKTQSQNQHKGKGAPGKDGPRR